MTDSHGSVEGAFILDPQYAQRLHQACPDLDDWPQSWHVEPADILVGQQIVQVLAPFLLHLLDQGLAKATFRRHRDNLWALGGELIRCRYDDNALAKKHVNDALRQLTRDGSWTADVAAHHRIGTGLAGCHLSKAESLLARIGQRRPIRLTQRPAPTSASPSAVQSCPRRRAVGDCDEPTDRRGGQLVSAARDRRKPPTNSPEEPEIQTHFFSRRPRGKALDHRLTRSLGSAAAC